MSVTITNELEWHGGKDIPEPTTGSFLILTRDGGIAKQNTRTASSFSIGGALSIKTL